MGIVLPHGMQFKVRHDPPLLIHVKIIGADGRSAITTVSDESRVNQAAEGLIKVMLNLPRNPQLKSSINKWANSSKKDRKKEQRRLRRLRRKEGTKNE